MTGTVGFTLSKNKTQRGGCEKVVNENLCFTALRITPLVRISLSINLCIPSLKCSELISYERSSCIFKEKLYSELACSHIPGS